MRGGICGGAAGAAGEKAEMRGGGCGGAAAAAGEEAEMREGARGTAGQGEALAQRRQLEHAPSGQFTFSVTLPSPFPLAQSSSQPLTKP